MIGNDKNASEKILLPADMVMGTAFERLFPWGIWNGIEFDHGDIPYIKGIQG